MKINSEEAGRAINTSIEVIKTHLNRIVTNDNLDTLTPKKVREELEKTLGLPSDSLKTKKSEINDLIDTIILELTEKDSINSSSGLSEKNAPNIHKKNLGESDINEEEQSSNLSAEAPKITKQSGKAPKRKQISMSIEEFLEKSQVLSLNINGSSEKLAISPRQFSTGSVGWYYGGKVPLPVGEDSEVMCQVSINCTVVGSKTWSQNSFKKPKSK
ncbi:apicomplexan specific [Cryptosporidium sp. chipmunk genotype I]|uniref:apicomplexan specific n=1 Tax=Cryptosporidium sp. chipmunk genotype I TaxID=1280935 RepID=UPI003519D98F|nr:apicomplexan specific [Cryptosporidium sp. chipmunk genotype I]